MKTFQKLIDNLPEDATTDRGFNLVDTILCSEDGQDLKEAWQKKDQAKAEIILRIHTKVAVVIDEAKQYMFKDMF